MILIENNFSNTGNIFIKVIEESPIRQTKIFQVGNKRNYIAEMAIQADYAFESAELGKWNFNFETNVLTICRRCKKAMGFPRSKATTFNLLLTLLPMEQLPIVLAAIRDAKEKGVPIDLQFPINGKSPKTGQRHWIRITGVIGAGVNNKAVKLFGTLADISTMMIHEISRQDFIAIVSHEMKSPLSSIKLYIQLSQSIALKTTETHIIKFLIRANDMVNKADKMLDCFLKDFTMVTKKLNLTFIEFDIHNLLMEIVDEVQFTHPNHQLILRKYPSAIIYADRDRIGQVAQNFLTNAIKYSPEPDTINITCKMLGSNLQVSIKDHGLGIATNEHHKIFDKYYRVPNGHEKIIPGYGIGLYLCKQIIDEHQGKIWFKSKEHKGSTFYFSLPLRFPEG